MTDAFIAAVYMAPLRGRGTSGNPQYNFTIFLVFRQLLISLYPIKWQKKKGLTALPKVAVLFLTFIIMLLLEKCNPFSPNSPAQKRGPPSGPPAPPSFFPVELDTPAYINAAGYTMLPIRAVAVALGINSNNVLWDQPTKTVTILYGQRIINRRYHLRYNRHLLRHLHQHGLHHWCMCP